MRSKVAEAVRDAQREEVRRMTPAERVRVVFQLRERGIQLWMDTHNVDRETALRQISERRDAERRLRFPVED